MGWAARVSGSAARAKALGYQTQSARDAAAKETASLRRRQSRGRLASMVAMMAMHNMAATEEVELNADLARRLGGNLGGLAERRGRLIVIRRGGDGEAEPFRDPESAPDEKVSGANALQRNNDIQNPVLVVDEAGQ